MPVALHAAAQHRAVQHVQRREQRRGAVALVVVGHGRGPSLLHRQPRLGAVERLDLALLVDRQHDRVRRRVHVEPDHVAQLGDERRVPGQLEGAHPVRGEPVRLPDPLHRAQRDPGGPRHRPAGPVGRLARRLAEGQLDHAVDGRRRQRRRAGLAGLVAQQAGHALAHEPLLPAPDARLGLAGPAHDLGRAAAVGGGQDDPGPPDMLLRLLRSATTASRRARSTALSLDGDPFAHTARHARQPARRVSL